MATHCCSGSIMVVAKIVGEQTLVLARVVAESFGASVDWDGATQTAIIVY